MNLSKVFKQHPFASILVGLTVLGTVANVLKQVITSVGWINALVHLGVHINKNSIEISAWFEIVILLCFALLIIVSTMYFVAQSTINSIQLSANKRTEVALKTLDGMMDAAFKIRQQLIPRKQPFSSFTLCKSQYLIDKDFSCEVVREFHLKATGTGINFFEVTIGAEEDAIPVEYLLDLNFQVKDLSQHGHFELAYLPTANRPRDKRVIIYFLPFIDPVEQEPRKIKVSYKWPGYFLHLKNYSKEMLMFSFPLVDIKDIELLECEVYLQPGTGHKLLCTKQGATAGEQSLENLTLTLNGEQWHGWKYTIKQAVSGEYALNLELVKA